jgi:aconitate hydratase 2/2-methylisocitrate dehydratase
MGNQARVAEKTTCVSTSTRNFPNRLGKGANVFLSSAELAAVSAMIGRIPTNEEYLQYAKKLDATAADTYRYLNFNELDSYMKASDEVKIDASAYDGLGPNLKAEIERLKKTGAILA